MLIKDDAVQARQDRSDARALVASRDASERSRNCKDTNARFCSTRSFGIVVKISAAATNLMRVLHACEHVNKGSQFNARIHKLFMPRFDVS